MERKVRPLHFMKLLLVIRLAFGGGRGTFLPNWLHPKIVDAETSAGVCRDRFLFDIKKKAIEEDNAHIHKQKKPS